MKLATALFSYEDNPYTVTETEKCFYVETMIKKVVHVKYCCKKINYPTIQKVCELMKGIFEDIKRKEYLKQ